MTTSTTTNARPNQLTTKLTLLISLLLMLSINLFADTMTNPPSIDMQVLPSASQKHVNIVFQTTDLDIVTINLYTENGIFVKKLMKEEETLGFAPQNRTISLDDVTSGVYYIKAITANGAYDDYRIELLP